MEHTTNSLEETQVIAHDLARSLSNTPNKLAQALIVALEGELGAGKTTFSQGFARGLAVTQHLTSPTFVIAKQYPIPDNTHYHYLWHIDCYRLRDYHDLTTIGFSDLIIQSDNIMLIEWPERIRESLPEHHITVHIDHITPTQRKITITL